MILQIVYRSGAVSYFESSRIVREIVDVPEVEPSKCFMFIGEPLQAGADGWVTTLSAVGSAAYLMADSGRTFATFNGPNSTRMPPIGPGPEGLAVQRPVAADA